MKFIRDLNAGVKLLVGLATLAGICYAGWAFAEDRLLFRGEADSTYATKAQLNYLSKTLPIEVELRFKRSEVDELRTIIMYGHEHDLDTGLDELRKKELLEKILTLEMALQRIERDGQS